MNGGLSLTHPALLWGLAAVAVPVLIHLLLRPRPRRVRFPALTLMQAVLRSGQRAKRVQNLLLLLVRTALVAGAAVLLAGPTCAPAGGAAEPGGPVACVLVLDDSLSLTYRPRFDSRETVLDQARGQLLALLADAQAWPADSLAALVTAGGPNTDAVLTPNRGALITRLEERSHGGPHARPLGEALSQAARLLAASSAAERRVVVFTDGAASAWRGVPGRVFEEVPGVTVRVVTPGAEPRTNLHVGMPEPPGRPWPASLPTPVRVTLASTGAASECWIVARSQDEAIARLGPYRLAANGQHELTIAFPSQPPGVHTGTIELEPADLLLFDQKRYIAWETVAPPVVWLVAPAPAAGGEDLSAVILRNLLAPESLGPDQQRVRLECPSAGELADRTGSGDAPALMVMLSGVRLAADVRRRLTELAENGATMLLVPGSDGRELDWPGLRSLICEGLPAVEAPAGGTRIRSGPSVADGLTDAELQELARCEVRQRVRLGGLNDAVRPLASYSDDVPAVLGRRLGRGRLLMLTTTPDPQWSDLGIRAAGLLMWLHRMVGDAVGEAAASAMLTAGDASRRTFGALPPGGLVQVSGAGDAELAAAWVRLSAGAPESCWPAETAGRYRVRAANERRDAAQYAVNWPAEESDLTPITRARLQRLLGTERVELARGDADVEAARWWMRLAAWVDPAVLAALGLIGLGVVEMRLAGRPSGSAGAN